MPIIKSFSMRSNGLFRFKMKACLEIYQNNIFKVFV